MVQVDVVDKAKHMRVTRALEQVNGLRYRYNRVASAEASAAKKPAAKTGFDNEEEENDSSDAIGAQTTSDTDATAESKADEPSLTLDQHIERLLLRTRTIALLKIANNTAEVLPELEDDDEFNEDDEDADAFDEEEDVFEEEEKETGHGGDAPPTDRTTTDDNGDRFDEEAMPPLGKRVSGRSMARIGSMQRAPSMRRSASMQRNPEMAAAMRLVRNLSSFLSLPKVISYQDLEEITEALLNEPHSQHDEYAHLIDEHVDSARDATTDEGSATNLKAMIPEEVSNDPNDLEMQRRHSFMRRISTKNCLSGHGQSQRSMRNMVRLESKHSMTHGASFKSATGSISSLAEEAEEKDDDGENASASRTGGAGTHGTMFDEKEYTRWRTEVHDDYLAWIRAKVEAKERRKQSRKKGQNRKPRWQLLFEAGKDYRKPSVAKERG